MIVAAFTGLVMGLTHVLSGPDHLAAIAPLAVRRPRRAWIPGMRWGLGHSAGVAVIGLLSLWLRELIFAKANFISVWGERVVGVVLIGIGCWALRKALRVHAHEHEHDGERHIHLHTHTHTVSHEKTEAHHGHMHAAFGIGILHGLAGSSHFLGVLTMLAFPTRVQSLSFLLTFGVGTVLAMACFSGLMGWITKSYAADSTKIYRRLMSACAIAAMGVGCFWLFF